MISTDPVSIYVDKLKQIQSLLNEEELVLDPTNPATMILEMNSQTTANSLYMIENSFIKNFPSLASDMRDLYPHISSLNVKDLLNRPGKATLTILVNLDTLKISGVYRDGAIFMSIPKETVFKVGDIKFTLLRSIKITYRNDNIIVEKLLDGEDEFGNVGLIKNKIIRVGDYDWISFDIEINELTINRESITVITNSVIDEIITYQGYLCDVNVYRVYDGVKYNVKLSFNQEYLEPNQETIFITLDEGKFRLYSPEANLIDKARPGEYIVEYKTCRVDGIYDLSTVQPSSWNVEIGEAKSDLDLVSTEVPISVLCDGVISGFMRGYTFEEMRDIVINNVKRLNSFDSEIKTPITKFDLLNLIKSKGYITSNLHYGIDSRTISVDKVLNILNIERDSDISHIMASLNVYTDDVIYPDLKLINDTIVIKQGTKIITQNGITKPFTRAQYSLLEKMSKDAKIDFYNKNSVGEILYNYNIHVDEKGIITLDVTDLTPRVNGYIIKSKNNEEKLNIDIDKIEVVKEYNGFKIEININSSDDITEIGSLLGAQLLITDKNNREFVLHSDYNGKFTFILESTSYVKDGKIAFVDQYIENIPFLANLEEKIMLSIYKKSSMTNVNPPELKQLPEGAVYTLLTNEEIDITFGKAINNIIKDVKTIDVSDKYLRYSEDIYLTYDYDIVLGMNGIDGEIIEKYSSDLDVSDYEIVHKKGDYVLDENGEKILLHKAGDIVYEDGKPVLVDASKRAYNLKVIALPYNLDNSNEYRRVIKQSLTDAMSRELSEINENLLTNTHVVLEPMKTLEPISVLIDGSVTTVDSLRPKIDIITRHLNFTDIYSSTTLIKTIGDKLVNLLNNETIIISALEQEIKSMFKEIESIKLKLVDRDVGVIKCLNGRRLRLANILDTDRNIYRYDIDINIIIT